jgi:hypothetical protein
MRLADHSVSLKALPVNALIGLEQTTRFTGGHDFRQGVAKSLRIGSEFLKTIFTGNDLGKPDRIYVSSADYNCYF